MSKTNELEQHLLQSIAEIIADDVVKETPEQQVKKLQAELAKCKEESHKAG